MTRKLIGASIGFGVCALGLPGAAEGAVVVSFDNNTLTNPFRTSVVNGSTSFSGSVTDPAYQGGTSTTLSFTSPRTGVTVTTPASPDFSTATNSFFGAEATGFGVGDSGLGRFTRGETYTLTSTRAISINSFTFHEWNGDEDVHFSWTEGGVAQSAVFVMSPGTGSAPSNVTVALSGIEADANTPIVITNVSATTDNSTGRLRFRKMEIAIIPEPAALGLLSAASLLMLRQRRRRAL